ncbi:MAG: lipocalin family protein [Rhizobiaceae bacterium]
MVDINAPFPGIKRLMAVAGVAVITAFAPANAAQIEPVTSFDIKRYSGKWYEIYRLDHRFERNLSNVTARYKMRSNGTLEVTNRGFNTKKCKWSSATGTGRFRGATNVADLKVSFFWPFSGAYKVFALDRKNYSWAAVAGNNRNYFWILSRSPKLPASVEKKLLRKAASLGFNVNKLIKVDHSRPGC